jgi:hypothetical protein
VISIKDFEDVMEQLAQECTEASDLANKEPDKKQRAAFREYSLHMAIAHTNLEATLNKIMVRYQEGEPS